MSKSPLKAIRDYCKNQCCSGSAQMVKFCTCDGLLSPGPACPLWLLRFGKRPATARKALGDKFLTPGALPDANVPLESCGSVTSARSKSGS